MADRSAEQSVAVAKEAASAASASAKVSVELLRIEELRQAEKYRDDLRRPLTTLGSAYREHWEIHTTGQSRIKSGSKWFAAKDDKLVVMLKAVDELLLITKGDDNLPALAMMGLLHEVRRNPTANSIHKLGLGMETLNEWSRDTTAPQKASEELYLLAHEAQMNIKTDPFGNPISEA